MNRKVVINSCYGGFGLSPLAESLLFKAKNPGKSVFFYKRDWRNDVYIKVDEKDIESETSTDITLFPKDFGQKFSKEDIDEDVFNDSFIWNEYEISRHDPDLVRIVESLGDRSWGRHAKLEVIDIGEKKYHIDEYDGYESLITDISDDYWS